MFPVSSEVTIKLRGVSSNVEYFPNSNLVEAEFSSII
jgi:hypothetical protein